MQKRIRERAPCVHPALRQLSAVCRWLRRWTVVSFALDLLILASIVAFFSWSIPTIRYTARLSNANALYIRNIDMEVLPFLNALDDPEVRRLLIELSKSIERSDRNDDGHQ